RFQILHIQSDDLNWKGWYSDTSFCDLNFLFEIYYLTLFANGSRLFICGMNSETDHHILYEYRNEANLWTKSPVEPSPAGEYVEGSYRSVVAVGTRNIFIGARSSELDRKRNSRPKKLISVKSQLAVLETDPTKFDLPPLQEAGVVERDRTYDAVFPELFCEEAESDFEEPTDYKWERRLSNDTALMYDLYKKMTNDDGCCVTKKLLSDMKELEATVASLVESRKTSSDRERIFGTE
ncbi:hypothetical protein PENTCL1PPCAC_28722, partial [Pristionchus entomophagus]